MDGSMAPVVVPPKDESSDEGPPKAPKPTSVRLPPKLFKDVERIAKESGRSRHDTLVRLIEFGAAAHLNRKVREY